MSVLTTILRAIGISVVPPVYLDSPIKRDNIGLDSEINNESFLKSKLSTEYDSGIEI